jgi:hypothetical protein
MMEEHHEVPDHGNDDENNAWDGEHVNDKAYGHGEQDEDDRAGVEGGTEGYYEAFLGWVIFVIVVCAKQTFIIAGVGLQRGTVVLWKTVVGAVVCHCDVKWRKEQEVFFAQIYRKRKDLNDRLSNKQDQELEFIEFKGFNSIEDWNGRYIIH